MMSTLLPPSILWLASLISALCVILVVVGIGMLWRNVPSDSREYLDPLPAGMRILWPLVRMMSHHLTGHLPPPWLERVRQRLVNASATHLMLPEHFLALQLVSGLLAVLLAWFCGIALGHWAWALCLFGLVFGFALPGIWLRDRRLRRDREVRRLLPVYIDYITLAVEAGLNLSGAMAQAIDNGPRGVLNREFGMVLRDVKAGLPRSQALRRMHQRIDLPEVGALVAAVNQAERSGGSLGKALHAQAERTRNERFQRAEKAAMEAPVKLLGPLIIFIFPTTFLVIAFPIAMMFLHGM